jgi:hypothetical protein
MSNKLKVMKTKKTKKSSDEIDLIEIFLIFYQEKWLIGMMMLISLLITFGYLQITKPNYKISIEYKINSSHNQNFISEGKFKDILLYNLDKEWSVEKNQIIKFTKNPLLISQYQTNLNKLEKKINTSIFTYTKNDLSMILNEISNSFYNTETIATEVLRSERILKYLGSGKNIVIFNSISIKKTLKTKSLIFISIVLSFFISSFIIIIRYNIKKINN